MADELPPGFQEEQAQSTPGPNGAPPLKTSTPVLEQGGAVAPVSADDSAPVDEAPPGFVEEQAAPAAAAAAAPAPTASDGFGVTDASFTPKSEASFAADERARVPESTKAVRRQLELRTPLDEATQQRRAAAYTAWLGSHQDASPEERAQTLELAAKYDLPPSLAESQRDQLLRDSAHTELLEAMVRAPALQKFLADGAKAPLVKDDLDTIARMSAAVTGRFEWWGSLADAFISGVEEPEYQGLAIKQLAGLADQDDINKLELIEARNELHGDFGATTTAQKAAVGLARAVPSVAGFAAAGATGGPAGLFALGMAQNAGPAFRSLKTLKANDGTPLLDDEQARTYSLLASTIGAAIFAIPGTKTAGKVFGALPFVSRASAELGTSILSKVLKQPGPWRTLAMAPLKLGLRAAEGGLLMFGQAAANAGAAELAKSQNGQDAELLKVWHAGSNAFMDGVITFAPLSVLGAGHELFHDLGLSKALEDNTFAMDLAVSAAKDSKLLERSPEQFEQLVTLNQPKKPNVYFNLPDWDEHWASKGEDPAAKAAEVMGDGGKAYAEAHTTGGDFIVPTEKYLSKLKDEHEAGLRLVARWDADQPSIKDQLREAERIESVAKETAANVDAPTDDAHLVAKDITDKAIAAGQDADLARANGAIWGATFRRFGQAIGMTAMDAYDTLLQVAIHGRGNETAFDFGENSEPSPPLQLELGRRSIERMGKANREAASAFLEYAQGKRETRPEISPELEKRLAKFGIVDPVNGYTFDESGRDMSRPTPGRRSRGERQAVPEELQRHKDNSDPDTYLGQPKKEHPALLENRAAFTALPEEEQLRSYYTEPVTGLLNERGFKDLPTEGRPLVGHISLEGVKFRNDKIGHGAADEGLRAVAEALHVEVPDAAKVGGDFAVRVSSNKEFKALLERVRERLPEEAKGFELTGKTGATLEEASKANGAYKEQGEAKGVRAKRGERPKAFASDEEALKTIPSKRVEGLDIPKELRGRFADLSPDERFRAVHVEPETGLLTKAGFDARPAKKFRASIDLNGLKVLNNEVGQAFGDQLLKTFGELAHKEGGLDFDLAHDHGDEYLAQSDDKEQLDAFLQHLTGVGEKAVVRARDEAGGIVSYKGVRFGYGIGEDAESADAGLNEHKARLKAEGKRGDELKRLEYTSPGREADAALDRDRRRARLASGDVSGSAERGAPEGSGQESSAPSGSKPEEAQPGELSQLEPGLRVSLKKDGDRGEVSFEPSDGSGKPRRFDIHLLKNADESTLAHETMHVFSEVLGDLAQREDAPPQLKEDYATLLQAMGHASHEERQAATLERRDLSRKESLMPAEEKRFRELTAKEERVTHAWEQYLAEGKSPSAELARPFARFKLWLTKLYRSLQNISRGFQASYDAGFELSDPVRRVFDRMLASEDEVARAQRAQELAHPFDAALERMTPEERTDYLDAKNKARDAAEADLRRALASADKAERTGFIAKERERISAEVDQELHENPTYATLAAIQEENPLGGEPLKLDRADFVKEFGKKAASGMPRGVWAEDGKGLPAAEVAMRTGWDGAQEMVDALRAAVPRERLARAETEQRLEQLYGPALKDSPQALMDEAIKDVHNEANARAVALEINAMRRALRAGGADVSPDRAALLTLKRDQKAEDQSRAQAAASDRADAAEGARIDRGLRSVLRSNLNVEDAKRAAAGIIGGKTVGDVTGGEQGLPGAFLRAERTAARAATDAAAKGDLLTAIAFKERQLTNMALYREARDVRDELERATDKLRGTAKDTWREYLGKADPAYRDAHDAILQAVGVQSPADGQPPPAIDGLLARAAADAQDLDFDVEGLQALIRNPRPWGELTVDQARNVMDAVTNIRTAARELTTLKLDGKRVSRDELFAEMEKAVSVRPPQPLAPRDASTVGVFDQGRRILQSLDAQLATPETLISMLDGHAKDGPFRRAILDAEKASRDRELELKREFLPKIVKAFHELPKELQEKRYEMVDLSRELPLPEDLKQTLGDGPVTRTYLWMIALNMGNEGNTQRLTDGMGWTRDQVMGVLNRHMSKAEWGFVQQVWDTFEGLYPEMAKMHEEQTGVRPGKVVATPVQTPHGELRGGYFPAREDPRAKSRPVRATPETILDMLGEEYRRAATFSGHAKARTAKADYVVNLSWSVVPAHLAQVTHDIAYRPFIRQTAALMLDKRFVDLTQRYLGTEYAKQFVPWLQAVAQNQAESIPSHMQGTQRVLGWVRGRANRQLLGGNLASMAKHFFDPLNAVAAGLVKPGDVAMAHVRASNPVSWKPMADFALASSKELQARQDHVTRELGRELGEIGDAPKGAVARARGSTVKAADAVLGGAHEWMDRYVTTITWTSAYTQAQRELAAEGLSHEDAHPTAVKRADDVVRKVYPSAEVAQMAAALRNKNFLGTSLMFAGFMNKTWNLKRQAMDQLYLSVAGADASAPRTTAAVAKFTGQLLAFAALSAGTHFLGGQGKKDDESTPQWAGRTMLADPLADVPLLGKLAEVAANTAVRGKPEKLDLKAAPVADFVSDLWQKANKSHENEAADERMWRYLGDLLTFSVAGAGAVQTHRSLDYVRQLQSGEARPRGLLDRAGGLIYGQHEGQGQNPFTAAEDAVQ